jgi:NAD(P)H-dependent FMN reductase
MAAPIIGFICGSLRQGSINAALTRALTARFDAAGAQTRQIDLGAYDLPIFHGDLDAPEGVARLKADMRACDGLIIVTPEYNGSLPALLKNAIDWVSVTGKEQFLEPVYGIASCTPGPMSGIMVLRELNYILTRVGADVVPVQVGVGRAANAFNEQGDVTIQPSSDLADMMMGQVLTRLQNAP